MSDLEYVDRDGGRWTLVDEGFRSANHSNTWFAIWHVLRNYGPLVPADFLADMEGATKDLGEAAEEIERLRAEIERRADEVASLRQQLDAARTERDILADAVEPFGECDPDCDCGDHRGPGSCGCHVTGAEAREWIKRAEDDRDFWREQQKLAANVAAGIADLDEEAPALRQMLRTEKRRREAEEARSLAAEADNARLLDVYRAAEAWRAVQPWDDPREYEPPARNLLVAVDAYRAGTPAEAPDGERA